jgi:hypothetical protein
VLRTSHVFVGLGRGPNRLTDPVVLKVRDLLSITAIGIHNQDPARVIED